MSLGEGRILRQGLIEKALTLTEAFELRIDGVCAPLGSRLEVEVVRFG